MSTTVVGIVDERRHPQTGIVEYDVIVYDRRTKTQHQEWMPSTTLIPTNTNKQKLVRLQQLFEEYREHRASHPERVANNGITRNAVHLLVEPMFEGIVVPTEGSSIAIIRETHYVLDVDSNTFSEALSGPDLQELTRDWPDTYRPNKRGRNNATTYGYIDHCIAVTQNVSKGSCSNVAGELFHGILETDVIRDFGVLLGKPHVHCYGYNTLTKSNLEWARQHFADQWQQRPQNTPGDTGNYTSQFACVRRICVALLDHFVDQTFDTELPLNATQLESRRRSTRLNPVDDVLTASLTTDRQQPGLYTYESTSDGLVTSLTFKTTKGLEVKGKSPWRTPNVVTLHPDILFCLDPPFTPKTGHVFDMGTALLGQTLSQTLRNYVFPNRSRMCAIELKTSRNYPASPHIATDTYTYKDIIHTNIMTVTRKYKQWMFNGTVFLIHVLYPFKKVVVSQIDINNYTGHNESARYKLADYYNAAVLPP